MRPKHRHCAPAETRHANSANRNRLTILLRLVIDRTSNTFWRSSKEAPYNSVAVPPRPSNLILLLAILFVGAVFRLALLWKDAPPLFADEIEQYVSVHSIVTTGADVDGRLLPFLDCRLGRNPPMYGVAGYVSTLVFGNSTFGWRFPAVVFGLIAIALTFLVVRELTKRDGIALLAALLLAIEPDHIHFSRIGWEPATVLPFLLGAVWFLLRALREPKRPLPFPF